MGRRRFAHLSDSGDEIHVDANIPWGSTTLFTLEFRDDSRLYAIHTANNRYLSRDGRLLDQCNATCLFSLEYHAGALALRDTQGLYLAPLGSKVCCPSHIYFIVIDFSLSLFLSPPPPPLTTITTTLENPNDSQRQRLFRFPIPPPSFSFFRDQPSQQ